MIPIACYVVSMKTNSTETQNEKLNRVLWSACMGNMGMAANWLRQAKDYIAQGGNENDFVAHAHPSNGRKAKAAYRLAQSELAEQTGEVLGYTLPLEVLLGTK